LGGNVTPDPVRGPFRVRRPEPEPRSTVVLMFVSVKPPQPAHVALGSATRGLIHF
jgi:hypothetical protein